MQKRTDGEKEIVGKYSLAAYTHAAFQ